MKLSVLAMALTSVSGFSISRRSALEGAVATALTFPVVANAIDVCPPKSSNCIRTTWTPPTGTSKSDVVKAVENALTSYPQEGQNKVDLGGYTIVNNDLKGSGVADVEYKSGIGNFAKFLNGGKPFVDDLRVEVGDGVVEVRSASRIGESDFDVNRKRLTYLAQGLSQAGWTVPEPKY